MSEFHLYFTDTDDKVKITTEGDTAQFQKEGAGRTPQLTDIGIASQESATELRDFLNEQYPV